ncbi:hypothetical protein [Streptomyces sp. NPDC001389]|uniref:hypothetical protein n=1 Tax=Streptomyces sp. NPDC001389 TaxID=3364569 RepID=UPI00367A2FB7
MNAVVIDQVQVRIIDPNHKAKPGAQFPRPLTWWQRYVPIWLDASEDDRGRIVLTPNGRIADGRVQELTPTLIRRDVQLALRWLDNQIHLDFTDALVRTDQLW